MSLHHSDRDAHRDFRPAPWAQPWPQKRRPVLHRITLRHVAMLVFALVLFLAFIEGWTAV